MTILFGGTGVQPTLRGQNSNVFSLQGGNFRAIPAGAWLVTPGLYSVAQEYDAVKNIYSAIGSGLPGGGTVFIQSDGINFRVANQSGCVVGAIVTTAGAGYTTAPAVTASNGGAVLKAIIGGAISTTVTVTNGGSGYVYPPIVLIDAPNQGGGSTAPGIQATAHATISSGAVSSITVDDQGAGYTQIPNVLLVNDPRDTAGTSAAAAASLTGAGTITAVIVTDSGNSYTSTAIPTLAFAGTSTSGAAATPIMNWSLLSYSLVSAGLGYAQAPLLTNLDFGFTTTAGSTTNPTITSNLVRTRPARMKAALSSTAITATGQVVYDGGVFTGVPTLVALGFSSGSAAQFTPTMGPVQDVTLIMPV